MRSNYATMPQTAETTSSHWWLAMIAGITVFIVGLLLLIAPGMTLLALVQLLGAYWLVTGILALVSLCVNRTQWGWKLVAGILGVIAGLVVLRHPLWSTVLVPTMLVIILAVDALIMGVTQLIHAFSGGGFSLGLLGILNIIFGAILLFRPLIGVAALPIVLGIFAVVGGIFIFFRALAARPLPEHVRPPGAQPA
jgi:uncharacterized membrane protein HdeD (DUF308 family)